jgi:hypothetical protein
MSERDCKLINIRALTIVEVIKLMTILKPKKPNYREHPRFKIFFQKIDWGAVGDFFDHYYPMHAALYFKVIEPQIADIQTFSRKDLYLITRKFWDAWND